LKQRFLALVAAALSLIAARASAELLPFRS
jgi:hypothetical protein